MLKRVMCLAVVVLAMAVPSRAMAAVIVVPLPDFNGPENSIGFPIDLGVVGTFTYIVPAGDVIAAATFSGTYGTQAFPTSTAGFDVVIAGHTINVCVEPDPCWVGQGALTPFSFNLNPATFATLGTGSVDLDVIQTSEFIVRLGTPTLTLTTRHVPEPVSIALFGTGLGLAAVRRLRRRG